MITRRFASSVLSLALSSAALALPARPAAAQSLEPPHLFWGVLLVDNVLPEHNTYGTSPNYVFWAGVNGARYENRTQCNSLLTHLLRQGYGWTSSDILSWMGSTSPSAAMWHDAIEAEDGWTVVATIDEVLPGDVLAIRYPAGSSVSGHVATVVDPPQPRVASSPLVSGTFQFDVTILDSTTGGHGPTDTRLQPDGSWDNGAGIGVMRLYTDAEGSLVGHTWSTSSGSVFYTQSTRHTLIGRLSPQGGGP
jgi:hypothetical protein